MVASDEAISSDVMVVKQMHRGAEHRSYEIYHFMLIQFLIIDFYALFSTVVSEIIIIIGDEAIPCSACYRRTAD